MIEVKNLYKSFNGTNILHDINAKFHKGKTNLIIGQSGSGKSVLTKCIIGLYKPEQGQILYEGKDIVTMDDSQKKELRQQIGMLFQGGALFDSLSVEENVMFPLTMFTNMSKAEMRDRANECLKKVDLINKNHLFPSETSGGMQKRIAIARAIVMNPKYLFCDEPNSGLDPLTSILIDNLIKKLTYELDITTVVITHDMNSVIEIGDNINFIYKGNNVWNGDKADIIKTDNKEINDFVYASKFMQAIKGKL